MELDFGQGVQKYMYISEPHNDFILATWAEEMGLLGVLFIILLYGIFIWRGVIIAMRSQDRFGSLVAIGITTMIGIQAIFNIAVVSSSMPVTRNFTSVLQLWRNITYCLINRSRNTFKYFTNCQKS